MYQSITGEDGNYKIQWNYDNTILSYYSKSDGRLKYEYVDANYNNIFESVHWYTHKDNLISSSLDQNENGNYEVIYFYDRKGDFAGKSLDNNDNGLLTYTEFVLESGDTLRLEDKDENGRFSILVSN